MATNYTVDEYPATAIREAAAHEGGGEVLNEWYELEKYINRRGEQLAKHPAFRKLCSTYYVARRHALEIFSSEQDTLSVQEVRRREIETQQDPLTILPTTVNTQTLDGFASYGDEEWQPGSKDTASRSTGYEAAAAVRGKGATDSAMADYDTVTASARTVFGPSCYSPYPQSGQNAADSLADQHAAASSTPLNAEPSSASFAAPGATEFAESSHASAPPAATASELPAVVRAQSSRPDAATGPAPTAVMTAAAQASPTPDFPSDALHLVTSIATSTGSPNHNDVSSPPRKARDSARATPDTSPTSMKGAGISAMPTVPAFPAQPNLSQLPEDSVEQLNQSESRAKCTKTVSPPVEVSKRPLTSTEEGSEEQEHEEPPPKRAKTNAAPDAAVPRRTRGAVQLVKKSVTAAPSNRAASKPLATQGTKRAEAKTKPDLEAVITGVALPQNEQEARTASAERKARLLSAYLATRKSRSKKAPDLMPEYFETSNFPASEKGDVVRCICGCTKDDGSNMIQCEGENCEVWQHSKCMLPGLKKKQVDAYEGYLCQVCGPWERREVVRKLRQARAIS